MPSASTDILAASRWDLPYEMIEQGRDTEIRLRLERSGAPVTPASVTIRVHDYSGTDLVGVTAATPTVYGARYVVPAAATSGVQRGEHYKVVWTATMADGTVVVYDQICAVVRRVLAPTVGDSDLRRRWQHLDPTRAGSLTREPTWQSQIDDAWITIQHRLLITGRRPQMLLSNSTLREAHLLLAGAIVHETLAIRGATGMMEYARELRAAYEREWGNVQIRYDEDEDGVPDSRQAQSAAGGVWLGAAPGRWPYRRGLD